MKSYLLIITAICALGLSSCGFTGESYTFPAVGAAVPVTITGFGAWCENNLTTIRNGTSAGLLIAAKAIKGNSVVTAVIKYASAAEVALQPLLGQSSVTYAQIDAALSNVGLSDPSGIYADVIFPAINLVAGYIVQLANDGTPGRVGVDVLTALVNGINDAVKTLTANP